MKERVKSYQFWAAIAAALIALMQAVGLKTGVQHMQEAAAALLGALAIAGIIKKPPSQTPEERGTDGGKTA